MFVQVANDADFDLITSQIHNRLVTNLYGYGEQSLTWATKRFSDGGTGFYIAVPRAGRDYGFDDIIGERPVFDTLPAQVPAGSYTQLIETVNIVYSVDDIENIGAFSEGTVLSEIYFLRKPSGAGEFIITIFRNSGEIVIVDLSDNSYKYLNSGIFKLWKPIYHEETDSITFFAAGGSEVKIYTYYMDTDTTFESPMIESGEGIQSRKIGTDGLIYFGAQSSTKIFSFDPDSQGIEEYGPMMEGLESTYIYDIAADENFVYSILRGPYNTLQYWVAIYNKTTTEIALIGRDDVFRQYVPFSLYEDSNSSQLFWRCQLQSSASTGNLVLEIKDGELVDLNADINLTVASQGYLPIEYNNIEAWPDIFGYEADIRDLTITGLIKYKTLIDVDFTELTLTDVELVPLGSRGIKLTGSEILRWVGAYSQLTRIDPGDDSVIENKDMPDASIYDVLKIGDKIYFSGYANITCMWDTSKAWNLGAYNLTDPLSNPRQVPFSISGGFYHYRLVDGPGDYMYVGVNKERTAVGTAVAWFNKNTFSLSSTELNLTLKSELAAYSFCDLLFTDNKLILVGRNKTSNAKSRIWIWNISAGHNINEIEPTRIDLDSALFRPEKAFVVDADTLILIDYRNICKVNITGTPTFAYRSVPNTVNMSDSSRYEYDVVNGLLYFLGSSAGAQYLYTVDTTTWVFTRVSSALPSTLYGPRTLSLIHGNLYMMGTVSYTDFGLEERSGVWIEKLAL